MPRSAGEASTDPDLHVTADQLARLASGALDPDERAVVERHLGSCPSCRTQIVDPPGAGGGSEAPYGSRGTSREARDEDLKSLLLGTFHERYQIKRAIGTGGMGMVYEALDLHLHRLVALKLLRIQDNDKLPVEEAAARLVREARAMAVLSHRNVVTVYDVGTHGDQVFVAMQLVEGTTLRGWLAERSRPVEDIVRMMIEAGSGLAAAHAAGLIHRDFKPDNVLVSKTGTARVTDFGLARRADLGGAVLKEERSSQPRVADLEITPTITRTGAIVGTPAYMAPEQISGECDARADQFSFCVTAWEALFGARPFAGSTWSEIYANVMTGQVRSVSAERRVPGDVTRALRRGMCAKADDRFSSMTELLRVLQDTLDRPRRQRRRAQLAVVAAVAIVATSLIAILAVDRADREPPRHASASTEPERVDEQPRSPMVTSTPIVVPDVDARPPEPDGALAVMSPDAGTERQPAQERDARPRGPGGAKTPRSAVDAGLEPISAAREPDAAPQEDGLASARSRRADVSNQLRSRGLLTSDLPAKYHASVTAADAAISRGDAETAAREVDLALAQVRAVVIDGQFVDRKLQRLNARVTALPEDQRQALAGLLKEVVEAWKRGDHAAANAKLNSIAARLGVDR